MLNMLQLLLQSLCALTLCRLCKRTLLHSPALCCAGTGHQHLGCAEDSRRPRVCGHPVLQQAGGICVPLLAALLLECHPHRRPASHPPGERLFYRLSISLQAFWS